MTCYHPIKAFMYYPENEVKPQYIFRPVTDEYTYYHHRKLTQFKLIKCGKCIGCQVDRSRQWANRMMLELKSHEKACFITLTYNDDNVPHSRFVDEDGIMRDNLTLRKKDFQDFMKRLRRQLEPTKVRYFACGEYGGTTRRPHYHAIIFGYDFSDDRDVFNVSPDYFVQYRSPLLERIWTNPETHESMGFSMICDVTWNTCAYVSRYCTKKIGSGRNIYYQRNERGDLEKVDLYSINRIEPEFNLMSRRPGIGRQYYEENKDKIYENNQIFLTNINGGLVTSPPTYFDRLYSQDNPDYMENLKEERRVIAEEQLAQKLKKTNLDMAQYLEIEETKFKERIKTLKREKV